MGAFEDFVNAELPKRVPTEIPPGGNLASGLFLRTTGLGINVEAVPVVPGGGYTPYVQFITVTGPIVPSWFDLDFLPAIFDRTQVELQGVGMVYGLTEDFHVEASQKLFWHSGVALDPGDELVVVYYV